MAEDQNLDLRIRKLADSWKIDTSEIGREHKLLKEYKSMKYTYIFSFLVGMMLIIPAAIITLLALVAEGNTIFGIEMNQYTFAVALIITLSSSISMKTAGLKLRFERIKTLVFLKEINHYYDFS
jgi:hypothetical protein